MPTSTQLPTEQTLLAENAELRARLDEAEETLRAIRSGKVDALVIETSTGLQIYTLQGQDAELNRFRGEILAQISDAVIVVDDDRRVTYVNASAAEQYGITASEALGHLVTEIFQYRWPHPGDEDRMMAALDEAGHWRGESIHVKRNGEVIHVESSVTRLHDSNGHHSGLLSVIRDITERKRVEQVLRESKERWKFALHVSNLGAWELNLANHTAWRSLRHDQIFGYQDLRPEWSYETFLQHVLEEDRAEVDRGFQQAIAEHQDWNFECRIRRADGSVRWIWAYGKHLGEKGESSGRLFGLVGDITERKQVEQALKDADRRKDEFLAMLAHELRNPLGPMRNVAQLLKIGGDAARISWCGNVIERQVGHLSQLVDDLLDISRITLGKIELKREPVMVADFVMPAVETIRPLIDARQQEFSLALPPQPLRVEGDPVRLTQVVTNLLSNAAKYTESGGHIELAVEQCKNEVCIRVCDTGCGIEPSALPHLFELFYQVDSDIARSQGGLGIGLSLVYRLVAMHGGSVQAFSAGLGQGSEFVVRLPLISMPEDAEAMIAPAHSSAINRELGILIVDDYYEAAESLAMVLELKGYRVWIAHDGLSALEMAKSKRPQVVILDVGLPVMDGYEVAKKLRQNTDLGEMFIIGLSGYALPNDRKILNATDFDEYMVKPADMEKLQKLLEKWQMLNFN